MVGHVGRTKQNILRVGAALTRSALASSVLGFGLLIAPGIAAEGPVAEHRTVTASGDRTTGADGIHFYGEVSKPNQPGKGYVIFSKNGSQVIGAIYYPQSEYSCFIGRQAETQLNVTLVPLNPMYAIDTIGSAEARALSVCRQEAARVRERPEQTASTPIFSMPQT
jgi:hypothetical protein